MQPLNAWQTRHVRRRSAALLRPSVAPYFNEEVRKELEARYGAKQLYENGLSVQTGLDLRLQHAAAKYLEEGLRRIDKRRGYRRATRNVLAEKQTVADFTHERWSRPMVVGVPGAQGAEEGAYRHWQRRLVGAIVLPRQPGQATGR